MARDEAARDSEETSSLLDRRSYLRLAGATAASVATVGTSAAASGDYETVTVSAGQTRTFRLGSGDALEDTLIDVTAEGATYRIVASGDDWAIRNVGVRGYYQSGTSSSVEPIVVSGNGVVENVYLGDGGDGKTTGIYVHGKHSGDIRIDRVNVQGWPDNAIYASGPGNSSSHSLPGGGGTVRITNTFSKGNGTSNFRLGTTGSYCKNCVSVGGDRGFWGYYEDTKLVDCDVSNAPIVAGEDYWEKGQRSTVTLENCRFDGATRTATSTNEVVGESVGAPDTALPSGVPTTATAAASGTTSPDTTDSGSTTDSTAQSGTADASGTRLELVAGSNASNVSYEFTVEGSVRKRSSASDGGSVAESNDSVTDNGDGTVTVSGVSGNGYGDAFSVDGVVTSMSLDESKWTIRYGGREVGVEEVALPNELVIDGSNRPNAASTYTVKVSGSAARSAALGSVNAHDAISSGEISGRVVGGTDGYRFSGEVTGLSLDGPANVRVEDGS